MYPAHLFILCIFYTFYFVSCILNALYILYFLLSNALYYSCGYFQIHVNKIYKFYFYILYTSSRKYYPQAVYKVISRYFLFCFLPSVFCIKHQVFYLLEKSFLINSISYNNDYFLLHMYSLRFFILLFFMECLFLFIYCKVFCRN